MGRIRGLIWVAVAASLFLVMIALSVVPIPRERLYIEALLDAGHVPLFTVFTVLLLSLTLELRRVRHWPRGVTYAVVLAIAVAMGLLTEWLQTRVARDADPVDFERDVLGALAAICAVAAARAARGAAGGWRVAVLAFAAVAFFGLGLARPAATLLDYRARDARFPVLADFDAGWERTFLVSRRSAYEISGLPTGWDEASGGVLAVDFEAGGLPAITLREPQADWSAFGQLEFDAFNPESTEVALNLRVEDNSHDGSYSDRYNGSFTLQPGPNHLVVSLDEIRAAPRTRAMNLHAMHSVSWFLGETAAPLRLLFDNVRLTGR